MPRVTVRDYHASDLGSVRQSLLSSKNIIREDQKMHTSCLKTLHSMLAMHVVMLL